MERSRSSVVVLMFAVRTKSLVQPVRVLSRSLSTANGSPSAIFEERRASSDYDRWRQLIQLRASEDQYIQVMDAEGQFRATLVQNTQSVREAQKKHNLQGDSKTTMLLGKAMTTSTLLSALLKGEERVHVSLHVPYGPIEQVCAESISVGEVRAYFIPGPDEAHTVVQKGAADNEGFLKIDKVLYNHAKPFSSMVPLVCGDFTSELAAYFKNSEQIDTFSQLTTILEPHRKEDSSVPEWVVKWSGGLLVQALPGGGLPEVVTGPDVAVDSGACEKASSPWHWMLTTLFQGDDFRIHPSTLRRKPVHWYCRCSKDHFKQSIINLAGVRPQQIREMQKNHQEKLTCQFCNTTYELSDADFDTMVRAVRMKHATRSDKE